MPECEIVELHRDGKLDAPSGTAKRTARADREAGGNVHEPIHSVRLPGPRRPSGGHLRRRGPDAHDPPRLDRPAAPSCRACCSRSAAWASCRTGSRSGSRRCCRRRTCARRPWSATLGGAWQTVANSPGAHQATSVGSAAAGTVFAPSLGALPTCPAPSRPPERRGSRRAGACPPGTAGRRRPRSRGSGSRSGPPEPGSAAAASELVAVVGAGDDPPGQPQELAAAGATRPITAGS